MQSNSSYYLDSFLAPLADVMARDDVTDIWINRPCEMWIETLGAISSGAMLRR